MPKPYLIYNMQTYKELVAKSHDYLKSLDKDKLNQYEKKFVKELLSNNDSLREYFFDRDVIAQMPLLNATALINGGGALPNLLPTDLSQLLASYLHELGEYSPTRGIYRISLRRRDFNLRNRQEDIKEAYFAFYVFALLGGDISQLVRGQYQVKDWDYGNPSFEHVITAYLLANNQTAIQAAREVLTSENNVGILTHALIRSIERTNIEELHTLLLQTLKAAQLQEGLRQSIVETGDECNLAFFERLLQIIDQENMLRFASVRRSVQVWAGLGYEEIEDKDIKTIFNAIRTFFRNPEMREEAYRGDNPLLVYVALYTAGLDDYEQSERAALNLIDGQYPQQVRVAAIYYLYRSDNFEGEKHLELLCRHLDDKYVLAFTVNMLNSSERFGKVDRGDFDRLSDSEHALYLQLFDTVYEWHKGLKANETLRYGGFEWFALNTGTSTTTDVLWYLAARLGEQSCIDRFLTMKQPAYYVHCMNDYSWGSNKKRVPLTAFIEDFFPKGSAECRAQFVVNNLVAMESDKFKRFAEIGPKQTYNEAQIKTLENKLKSKVSTTRQRVIAMLLWLPDEQLIESYTRIQKLKAPDIEGSLSELREGSPALAKAFGPPTTQTTGQAMKAYPGEEGGYGLYTPVEIAEPEVPNPFNSAPQGGLKGMLSKITGKDNTPDVSGIFAYTYEQMHDLYLKMEAIIDANADRQYKDRWNDDRVLGDRYLAYTSKEGGYDSLPFPELWEQFFEESGIKDEELYGLYLMVEWMGRDDNFLKLDLPNYPLTSKQRGGEMKYRSHFREVIEGRFYKVREQRPELFFEPSYLMSSLFYFFCNEKKIVRKTKYSTYIYPIPSCTPLNGAMHTMTQTWRTDEEFARCSNLLLAISRKFYLEDDEKDRSNYRLPPLMAARMNLEGRLTDDQLMQMLMAEKGGMLESATFVVYKDSDYRRKPQWDLTPQKSRYDKAVYEHLRNVVNRIANHLFDIELTRRNAPTPATDLLSGSYRSKVVLWGTANLQKGMAALGKEHLVRDYSGKEKRAVLTSCIVHCYPLDTDTPDMLKGIDAARLVELAFFAPQWMELVRQHLNWKGFDEAYYYFVAHTKESDSEEKRATIALYTDLAPEDLADGAFDARLFNEAFKKVGKKNFALFYDAAKYMGSSNYHGRARRFADVTQGLIKEKQLMEQIDKTRNKDALCALGLVPLPKKNIDTALLKRYKRIQAFLKESKQFGAQRQASEKRTVEIALINLARSAGYDDVIQLVWRMEGHLVADKKALLDGMEAEGYLIRVEIAPDGTNKVVIEKDDKPLKSVPTKLKKNATYLEVNQTHKEWTLQYRRAREIFEDMMRQQTTIMPADAAVIEANPIVAPLFAKLLVQQHDHMGLYAEGKLHTLDGEQTIDPDTPLTIVHPYHLHASGKWAAWQSRLFEMRLVQPFKQVFRELYVPIEEEADKNESRRYSGYQIQVRQTLATLRSRGWVADYEEGLRKVFHKQGVVVSLYARADWFSPSDIEAPAIEYVRFDRTRGIEPLRIADVDPVLYSEVMRDVDLAVSIAFVGGVDPETGQSTRELRAAIVRCTAEMLKLNNVRVDGNFAFIEGTLADYTVHLGSANVRQQGGKEIPIVPVHSSQRGKLYLPFVDEDPKTVEIVSKVVLLAEDNKLKDPTILQWIERR